MTPTSTEPLAAEPGRAAEARAEIRTKRGQLGGGMDDAFARHPGRLRWPCRRRPGRRSSWWGEIRDAAESGQHVGKGDQRPLTNMARELLPCFWGAIGGTKKQTPYTWTSD